MNHVKPLASLGALLLSMVLLQGCGASTSTSSTDATATPNTTSSLSGTVTGFGSVMVDGQEVEDAYAHVAHENADGSLTNDVLQMGQRVRVAHNGSGRASQVLVDAAVIGQVSAVGSDALTVAGQAVTVNVDTALGPVTVFGGGYSSLSDVVVNDLVQIHGTPIYDSASKTYKVQATRIQKDAGSTRVQVSGKIADYVSTSTGAGFTLNGLKVTTTSATALRPLESTLGNSVQVTAYGVSLSGSPLTLIATNIRVDRNQSSGSTLMQAQLSGVVSAYNAADGSLEVQGMTVKLGTATVLPAGAVVADKAYVMVKGTLASDGSMTATQIHVRTADTSNDLAKVMLIGTISDYMDESSFLVRGVPVDASSSDLERIHCPATLASYTDPVRVQAQQQAGTAVVKAQRIECRPADHGNKLVRPMEGTVASVDSAAQTFSIAIESGSQTVQWNDTTTFLGVTADTLTGKTVHVDGYSNATLFVARVVRLDDGSERAPPSDGERFRRPKREQDAAQGWEEYRKRR